MSGGGVSGDDMFSRGHTGGYFEFPPGRFGREDFDALLLWSIRNKVSDLTIQSSEPVWAEIGGEWHRVTRRALPHHEVSEIVREIYGENGPGEVNAGRDLDPSYEVREEKEDESGMRVTAGRWRYRVNITCGRMIGGRGFQVTVRTLPGEPLELSSLQIEPEITENLRPPQGMNLFTGPTGSGKSTLMSSVVRHLCSREKAYEKVVEYSMPIEFVYDTLQARFPDSFVFQTEPGNHLFPKGDDHEGSVWSYCVRNALRRKPTMIILGEARDKHTIQGCIEAALTGHMVMSTMHTIGVPETIRRAMMPFPAAERRGIAVDLLESLNLVVTQLLLPRQGGGKVGCREFLVIDRKVRAGLAAADPDEWPQRVREMMNQRQVAGRTMAESAKALLDRGEISPHVYEWIAARTAREARVVRDAAGAGLLRAIASDEGK